MNADISTNYSEKIIIRVIQRFTNGRSLIIVQRDKKGETEERGMESIPSMQTMIPGFRFRPYDDELITDYLLKKIKGEALPWEGFVECDIYDERSP